MGAASVAPSALLRNTGGKAVAELPTTFNVVFDNDSGFDLQATTPFRPFRGDITHDVSELPESLGGQYWCVADGDSIYGPYLSQEAAQSLITELSRGELKPLLLV